MLRRAKQNPEKYPWLTQLLARRPFKVVAIALANKMARVAWALLVSGERLLKLKRSLHASLVPQLQFTGSGAYAEP